MSKFRLPKVICFTLSVLAFFALLIGCILFWGNGKDGNISVFDESAEIVYDYQSEQNHILTKYWDVKLPETWENDYRCELTEDGNALTIYMTAQFGGDEITNDSGQLGMFRRIELDTDALAAYNGEIMGAVGGEVLDYKDGFLYVFHQPTDVQAGMEFYEELVEKNTALKMAVAAGEAKGVNPSERQEYYQALYGVQRVPFDIPAYSENAAESTFYLLGHNEEKKTAIIGFHYEEDDYSGLLFCWKGEDAYYVWGGTYDAQWAETGGPAPEVLYVDEDYGNSAYITTFLREEETAPVYRCFYPDGRTGECTRVNMSEENMTEENVTEENMTEENR